MSEASEGTDIKAESVESTSFVKETTILTNIPMGETIDLQHALVIVPESSDGNLQINTIHESDNVVVVASVTSNGELITPDLHPLTSTSIDVKPMPADEDSMEDDANLTEDDSMNEDDEYITENEEATENEDGNENEDISMTEDAKDTTVEEPIDPNTCTYCGKVFKSQTVSGTIFLYLYIKNN